MADQLSGISIIICIAFGFLTFVLLFIFAKRQIARFSLKSRRGPHVPVGNDAPKPLRLEIERRLDCIKNIHSFYRPKLLNKDEESFFLYPNCVETITTPHLYRMHALESFSALETDLFLSDPSKYYPSGQDVRVFLLRSSALGLIVGCEAVALHQLADLYQCARHELVEFGPEKYKQFMDLLSFVRQHVNLPSHKSPHHSSKRHSESSGSSSSKTKENEHPVLNGKPTPILRRPTSLSFKSETGEKSVTFETSV
ncbi:uncharacterized protein C1orf43 homolog [Limulus polyphemus]|uniref:Uncharacterized protein C1orf43 homolog n=1 Tax=Limulus polyphemus TaxID=6850 RepID=A0ABM1C5K9_LIMPO|nr:uncharacterized protein C1orf43 homolog [Limulus polyphemus]XP_022237936.1 uncharacterized protein C1orf43 homolog [Limulus polyphemus]